MTGRYGLVPPALWLPPEACCGACWDAHRAAGLPVAADYACCGGGCGPDPRQPHPGLPDVKLPVPAANVIGTLIVIGAVAALGAATVAGTGRVRRR